VFDQLTLAYLLFAQFIQNQHLIIIIIIIRIIRIRMIALLTARMSPVPVSMVLRRVSPIFRARI
jgi:hypothetical protein